ncbi:hypothetical protein [Methylocystis sp. S23]
MIDVYLAQAERHIATGEKAIKAQRLLVLKIGNGGRDALRARRLLAQYEEIQQLQIAARDRLREELLKSCGGSITSVTPKRPPSKSNSYKLRVCSTFVHAVQ